MCRIGQNDRCSKTGCEFQIHFGAHCHGDKIATVVIPTYEELVMQRYEAEKLTNNGDAFLKAISSANKQQVFKLPIEKKKQNNKNAPSQPEPISIENFFVSTKGTFTEINEVPPGFVNFYKSKKSYYYHNENKDVLVRVSDHWGSKIRFCAWFLDGYDRIPCTAWNKSHGKSMRVGIIFISELKPNKKDYQQIDKIQSRHPF